MREFGNQRFEGSDCLGIRHRDHNHWNRDNFARTIDLVDNAEFYPDLGH
jgi:hypothetical protein